MKRLFILSAVMIMQVFVAFAQEPTSYVNRKQVKMYRQPGIGTDVVRVLTPEDAITVVRQINNEWSLVQINGEGGYVLNDFLKEKKGKKATAAKASRTAPSAANF
ncbi:MAG: SH3 domain-containing protein [Rufibacter sp.]